jgi:hypothetical protein
LNEPQLAALQLTFQFTPMFAGSLERVAISITCPPVTMEEGGACVNTMESGLVVARDLFVTHDESMPRAERMAETSSTA